MALPQDTGAGGGSASCRPVDFRRPTSAPDTHRHYAAHTFTAKLYAEGWLSNERQSIELGTWTGPAVRAAAKRGEVLTLADYADTWIEHRNVKPRTKIEYQSLFSRHITESLGRMAIRDLNPNRCGPGMRAWDAITYGGTATPMGFCTRSAPRRSKTDCWRIHVRSNG